MPKVHGRGHGANSGRGFRRVRLADIGQPHRDHAFASPPLERLTDHVSLESGDAHEDFASHGNISRAYTPTPPPSPLAPVVAPPVALVAALLVSLVAPGVPF